MLHDRLVRMLDGYWLDRMLTGLHAPEVQFADCGPVEPYELSVMSGHSSLCLVRDWGPLCQFAFAKKTGQRVRGYEFLVVAHR